MLLLLFLAIVFLALLGILFFFKEKDRQLVQLLHTPGMTVWVFDVKKSIFVWLGQNGKPVKSMTFDELKEAQGEANTEKLYEMLNRLVQGKSQKESSELFLKIEHDTQPLRHLLINISVLKTRHGQPVQIIGIARDITKDKDIANYVHNIDYVLRTGNAQIVRYDIELHQLSIYRTRNEVGLSLPRDYCLRLVADECKEQVKAFFNQMDAGKDCLYEYCVATKLHTRDGKQIFADFRFNPIYDNKTGKLTSYFGLCRDITEQKATEAKLLQEQEKALEAEKAQDIFIKNISNEVHKPLNAIIDNANMFQKAHRQEDEPDYINAIKENTQQLLQLADEVIRRAQVNIAISQKTNNKKMTS